SWWKRKLTSADLATASPYNTYTRLGLPPAPIANPGIATLSAAASYSRTTPYWYYLHCKDGKVRYSKTLAEHTANQACIK
ncbi:MAG: endolytic transglycosylase MltG, partial [Patescibacteria group bacterium]